MPRIEDLVQIGFTPIQAKHLGVVTDGVEGTFSALTATGTTQGTGYAIIGNYNQFTTVAAGANAATLPLAITSAYGAIVVRNSDSADNLILFPGVGDTINNLAANTSIVIPPGASASFYRISNTKWIATLSLDTAAIVNQTEVDFGATPVSNATFTVTDSNVSATSQLIAQVAWEAPTGKEVDEIEMDDLQIRCKPAAGSFDMYIETADGSYLADKFKINYLVG